MYYVYYVGQHVGSFATEQSAVAYVERALSMWEYIGGAHGEYKVCYNGVESVVKRIWRATY